MSLPWPDWRRLRFHLRDALAKATPTWRLRWGAAVVAATATAAAALRLEHHTKDCKLINENAFIHAMANGVWCPNEFSFLSQLTFCVAHVLPHVACSFIKIALPQ